MYTVSDREALLKQITTYISASPLFEGLLMIGSGAEGFRDLYSDIDLMAGCVDENAVPTAKLHLLQFFLELGACHTEKRAWTRTVLGMSVYFENGLSVDLSFMPTKELPIKSPKYRVLISKSERFTETVSQNAELFQKQLGKYGMDDSIHYRFITQLRYARIALLRRNFVFADMALSEARQILLAVETVSEGKKLHQFKAYNTLEPQFLARLEATYPVSRSTDALQTALDHLLALYLDTVSHCGFLSMKPELLKLLDCFE